MVLAQLREKREKEALQLPRVKLEYKHTKQSTILPSRELLLEHFPKGGVVAEIGVDEGDFSEKILEICQPAKLHLIDFWGSQQYNQAKRQKVEHKFREQIKDQLVEINLGLSTQAASQFPDDYFDWIYIDSDHSYQTTKEELELYHSKVKSYGIIAGHDYAMGDWGGMGLTRYGVIEAVHEFCMNYDWEIIFLTIDATINPSFAIRRIGF